MNRLSNRIFERVMQRKQINDKFNYLLYQKALNSANILSGKMNINSLT